MLEVELGIARPAAGLLEKPSSAKSAARSRHANRGFTYGKYVIRRFVTGSMPPPAKAVKSAMYKDVRYALSRDAAKPRIHGRGD